MISIVSLIYKSPMYADSIYNTVHEYTNIKDGEIEFFFVANDPTDVLLEHLKIKKYPYILNINEHKTEEELFKEGIGWPEYLNRVYKGWNCAIRNAKDIVVLLNSDMILSPDWLDNLLKYLTEKIIICSQLIERNHETYGVFPGAIHGEFGGNPVNFNKDEFLKTCAIVKKDVIVPGGAYMPCMFYKKITDIIGFYPEGNLHDGTSFNVIKQYGDEAFFKKAKVCGIEHVTAMDSICYHFKEGEKEDSGWN